MATIYDVDPNMLIERAAKELEKAKVVSPPSWAAFVKTGAHKSRLPDRQDWWYIRSAAILRTVYRLGPIGTQKLRTKYGGRADLGYKPERTKKGSGSVIRKILQQLEKSGYVMQVDKEGKKGRIATPKGKSFLDKIASQILKENPSKKLEPLKIVFEDKKPAVEEREMAETQEKQKRKPRKKKTGEKKKQ